MNKQFLTWLEHWIADLKPLSLAKSGLVPNKAALISVDMVNGFCHQGPLASKNVTSIIPKVIEAFNKCREFGVSNFLLLQDTHSPDASEFEAYPPHCQRGSKES